MTNAHTKRYVNVASNEGVSMHADNGGGILPKVSSLVSIIFYAQPLQETPGNECDRKNSLAINNARDPQTAKLDAALAEK